MKINDIVAKFDALKPGLQQDFINSVTKQHARLLERVGDKGLRSLAHSWAPEGYVYRNLVRGFVLVRNGQTIESELDTEYLAKRAATYADDQIKAFTIKLLKKLGSLDDVTIADIDVGGFTFHIYGKLGGRSVGVEQVRIINVSPKGNLFHQWPTRIYVDGKFTPEAAFKKLAA